MNLRLDGKIAAINIKEQLKEQFNKLDRQACLAIIRFNDKASESYLKGRLKIANELNVKVEVFTPKMRTSLLPLLDANLTGLTICNVRRRARYLVVDLSDKRALLMHFGMSGVVRIEDSSIPKRKHEHVFIHLSNGKIFRFECTRRFSLLECVTLGEDNWPSALANLGVEPLEEDFTPQYLYQRERFHNFLFRRGKRKRLHPTYLHNSADTRIFQKFLS
jgi:hypothetical protein